MNGEQSTDLFLKLVNPQSTELHVHSIRVFWNWTRIAVITCYFRYKQMLFSLGQRASCHSEIFS